MKETQWCKSKNPSILEFLPKTKSPKMGGNKLKMSVPPPKTNTQTNKQTKESRQTYSRKMLRLLGFPKTKHESGPGCSYCLASTLYVPSGGQEGPHTKRQWAPGGCQAGSSKGSHPAFVCLPPSETESTQK